MNAITGISKTYIVLNSQTPSLADATQIIQEILLNLEALGKAMKKPDQKACESFLYMRDLYQRYYLSNFVPLARRIVGGALIKDQIIFNTFPPSVLHLNLEFIARVLTPKNLCGSSSFSDYCKTETWLNEASREIINEVIRQGLMLPYNELRSIRGSLQVLRSLFRTVSSLSCLLIELENNFKQKQESPSYLQALDGAPVNRYVRRYLRYCKIPFFQRELGKDFDPDQMVCVFLAKDLS